MDENGEKGYTHRMSVEKVREFLRPYGRDKDIIEFPTSSATVAEAAADLGTEEGRIAKSMSFLTSSGPIVIVMTGDVKIDNRKFRLYTENCGKQQKIDKGKQTKKGFIL